MNRQAQKLDDGTFSRYGEAIMIHKNQKPNSSGEGWECWYPLSDLSKGSDFSFGIVLSKPRMLATKCLERHADRPEYVIALDHPIIQIVGLSDPQNDALPDIGQTAAYLIEPGQMVKINPGVWHSAGLAYEVNAALYLFLLGRPTRQVQLVDSGLVAFGSGVSLSVI